MTIHQQVDLNIKTKAQNRRLSRKSVSNFTEFMAEPVRYMRELASGGDIQRVFLGPKPFVFVFNPDAAYEILVKRPEVYIQNRTVFDRIQPVTGRKGLVQLSGAASQAARAKSRALFTPSSLDAAKIIIERYCDGMIESLGDNPLFDVTEEMTRLILKTAVSIFLGVESEELTSQIGNKFLRLNYLCGLRMRSLVPPPLFIPTQKNREIKSLQSDIRKLITKHILTSHNQGVVRVFRDDPDLVDHCMTFLFAGHETTASSLAFTLLLLAQHPQYQDVIAKGDEAMTVAVYKESLRLFPPAYMLAREAATDSQLFGFDVQKSDQVIIGVSELQRQGSLFDSPHDFRPERFLGKLSHPFSFIPFGAGAKSCVGERLAYLEATLVLQKMCRRYRFSFPAGPIRSEPLITLHPVPHQIIDLQPRLGEA